MKRMTPTGSEQSSFFSEFSACKSSDGAVLVQSIGKLVDARWGQLAPEVQDAICILLGLNPPSATWPHAEQENP
jgi:hypothetical protein